MISLNLKFLFPSFPIILYNSSAVQWIRTARLNCCGTIHIRTVTIRFVACLLTHCRVILISSYLRRRALAQIFPAG